MMFVVGNDWGVGFVFKRSHWDRAVNYATMIWIEA